MLRPRVKIEPDIALADTRYTHAHCDGCHQDSATRITAYTTRGGNPHGFVDVTCCGACGWSNHGTLHP